MKYQYILNGKVIFQTNNITEYYSFLINNEDNSLSNLVLFELLKESKGHILELATTTIKS